MIRLVFIESTVMTMNNLKLAKQVEHFKTDIKNNQFN